MSRYSSEASRLFSRKIATELSEEDLAYVAGGSGGPGRCCKRETYMPDVGGYKCDETMQCP